VFIELLRLIAAYSSAGRAHVWVHRAEGPPRPSSKAPRARDAREETALVTQTVLSQKGPKRSHYKFVPLHTTRN
jgi:hypothetical protein